MSNCRKYILIMLALHLLFNLYLPIEAATYRVSSAAQISSTMQAAQPGDTLLMNNGIWSNSNIVFSGSGNASLPIVLRAETPGQVFLTGQSNLRIGGTFLIVDGLVFQNGYSPTGGIVEFRNGSLESQYCRLTNCAIIDYNPASVSTDYKWVSLYGTYNRVDHCYLKGKNHAGTTLVVWLSAQPNYHLIDSNYFGHRPVLGENGGETIRIGTSDWSLYDSYTTVEYNYFEKCDGEIEIISNKSCENMYRHNTFVSCQGTLTLRHGNRCLVEGNYFFANKVSNSGGVRIIGEDHIVINNYIVNCDGTSLKSAITLMNGVPDSPLNRYFQVKRALVAFNTLVNNRINFNIGGGKDSELTLPPLDCTIANNIVKGSISPLIQLTDQPINMKYEGNIFHGATLGITPTPTGIMITDPMLQMAGDSLWRPMSNSPAIGGSVENYTNVTIDIDGHPRTGVKDVGCDQVSADLPIFKPLKPSDIGPSWMRSSGSNIQSVSSGNWFSASTWQDGMVPTFLNDVTIVGGHTVTINSTNAQCNNLTVNGNLEFLNTSPVGITVNGDVNVTGNFSTVARSSADSAIVHSLTIKGNLTSSGTFDMRVGSSGNPSSTICAADITFSGSANTLIDVTSSSDFNGVTINKSGGAKVILLSNVTQNNNSTTAPSILSLINGIIETGQYTWSVLSTGSAAGVQGGNSNSYVDGLLCRGIPSGTNISRVFPVGDANNYRPLSVVIPTGVSNLPIAVCLINGNANNGSSQFIGNIDKVSGIRYYQLTNNSTTSAITFKSFTASYGLDDGVMPGNKQLRVATSLDERNTWIDRGPDSLGSRSHTTSLVSIPTLIQSDDISGNLSLSVGQTVYISLAKDSNSTGNQLPVQLSSFTAQFINNSDVLLEWRTISEINNYGFYVQRFDEISNEFITVDESFQPGAGYTLQPQYYSWTDINISNTGIQYRLKQIDNDGLEHYFGPVNVLINPTDVKNNNAMPAVFELYQNYPNPFNSSAIIKFTVEKSENTTLKLFNILGTELKTLFSGFTVKGKIYEVCIDVSDLPTGFYLYKLENGKNNLIKKMLLIR